MNRAWIRKSESGLAPAVLIGVVSTTVFGQSPGITNIGVLPGWERTVVRGMSSDGSTVVGWAHTGSTGGRAYRWTAATGMQDLGAFPGEVSAVANAVSRDGSVISGWSGREGFNPRMFRWTAEGGMQDIGLAPGVAWSFGYGISQDGAVVVGRGGGGVANAALRWTADEGLQVVGSGIVTDANADGSVAVGAQDGFAHRWVGPFVSQNLGTLPGGSGSSASTVSDDGSVVGGYARVGNQERAIRWTAAGGMQDLGVLPGTTSAGAFAMTPDGSVLVGQSSAGNITQLAFMWSEQLGMVDLNVYLPGIGVDLSGWTLLGANGISEDGNLIAGDGLFEGQARGWVVVIPSPGAGAATLALGGLVALRRRRRG